jgi:hypothetical protein
VRAGRGLTSGRTYGCIATCPAKIEAVFLRTFSRVSHVGTVKTTNPTGDEADEEVACATKVV